jgi:carbonic anhydrase/acetyltransferase-like protein (isoleucine patch superfamily)
MPIILPYKNKFPKIADDAFIAPNAVIIGDVESGSKSSVWYGVVIRGDVHHIRIGSNTNIQDNSVIHVSRYEGPTIIGNGVTVGHQALLHACILDDNSFVGMAAQVIDQARVETHAMVAASSLVSPRKVVKTGELWAGVPAKLMRSLKQEEIDYIKTSELNYMKLAEEHMQICGGK